MAPLKIMENNTASNHLLNAIHIARYSAYVKSEFGRTFSPASVFRGV